MIGTLMKEGKREEAEELKKKVQENAERVEALSKEEKEVEAKIKQNMMIIPNIIDPSVPIGKDDSENVEIEKFGEPVVPDYEIPYHTDIMESFNGIDLESAGKVAEPAPPAASRLPSRWAATSWQSLHGQTTSAPC